MPLIEAHSGRYFEPFMGSAALFFSLRPRSGILSDLNAELVSTFQTIRSHPREVARLLGKLRNNEETYYEVRAQNSRRLSEASQAARFIYLNRFCFNGLYRTNTKGRFNVPYGRPKNDNRPTAVHLAACSEALANTDLVVGDFENVVASRVRSGDIVYLKTYTTNSLAICVRQF